MGDEPDLKSTIEQLINSLNSLKSDMNTQIESLKSDMNSMKSELRREIENLKYKQNMNFAAQTPPTYMDALSSHSITGRLRNINSHYLD